MADGVTRSDGFSTRFPYLVGVDVGGTFTDLVVVDRSEDSWTRLKVPSTPDAPHEAVLEALARSEVPQSEIDTVIHGTTVGTNAVLERRVARTALLTTAGFEDILAMGRRTRATLFGLSGIPNPLVPSELTYGVVERMASDGTVVTGVDEASLANVMATLSDQGVEAIAISFLHAHANDAHERAVGALAPRAAHVALSSEVTPTLGEFERTSTTAINASLMPIMSSYVAAIGDGLAGTRSGLRVVNSSGGFMKASHAEHLPVRTLLSGPAAGVSGATALGRYLDLTQLVTFDMGGTSSDLALSSDGRVDVGENLELDFRIVIRQPMLEIRTVATGGASIASVSSAGLVQVGPESASRAGGPACFGKGGRAATLTDADCVLGFLDYLPTLGRRLDRDAAVRVVSEYVARPLGLSVTRAATAIREQATQDIARKIRQMTVERGVSITRFTLVAFGGAGPMHACAVMDKTGIRRALIPSNPGLQSAVGCVLADERYDVLRSVEIPMTSEHAEDLASSVSRIRTEVLNQAGYSDESMDVHLEFDGSYAAQRHVVRSRVPERTNDARAWRQAFEETYAQCYGGLSFPVPSIAKRLLATAKRSRHLVPPGYQGEGESEDSHRLIRLDGDEVQVPVLHRSEVRETVVGPAIIEQYDSTIWVADGYRCRSMPGRHVIIEKVTT